MFHSLKDFLTQINFEQANTRKVSSIYKHYYRYPFGEESSEMNSYQGWSGPLRLRLFRTGLPLGHTSCKVCVTQGDGYDKALGSK